MRRFALLDPDRRTPQNRGMGCPFFPADPLVSALSPGQVRR
jgi:hypothetical protein